MELEGGVQGLQLAEEGGIKAQSQFRVVSTLQQELVAAPAKGFFDLPFVSVEIGYIGIGVAGYTIEIAELTVGDADIGRIGIEIDLPGDLAERDLFFP